MFRLIEARGKYWPYQLTLHFVVMTSNIEEILHRGESPTDELLTSLAATAGTAAEWFPGLVAAA